jgi:CDP-diglyceride synthetase
MIEKIIISFYILVFFIIIINLGYINLVMNIILNIGIYELLYVFYNYKTTTKLIINTFNNIIGIFSIVLIELSKYMLLYKNNKNITIIILFLTAINDTMQEFFGKIFGKNKIKYISPNKTIEGYIGGYLSLLISNYSYFKINYKFINLLYLGNVIGDLFF